MAAQPQRRPVPVPHLGPHIVPVERALKARAEAIETSAGSVNEPPEQTRAWLAAELRALAEELHHW